MNRENRQKSRIRFEQRHLVNLMAVDGTWRLSCVLLDVSESGAKLELDGSANMLQGKEFFLVLSSTGLAFRKCELVWIDGAEVGVRFIAHKRPRTMSKHVD